MVVTHGPRVMLVTWPATVKALSSPANPARARRGFLIPARHRGRARRLALRAADEAAAYRLGAADRAR